MWISPKYEDTSFTFPLTIDQKILLFEDRTIGWQLAIANKIINGSSTSRGVPDKNAINGSGFVILNIVLSYFEMIAKYRDGYVRSDKSAKYFKKGVHLVFPNLKNFSTSIVDKSLDILYVGGRCGLYHGGITDDRIVLTHELSTAMGFDSENQRLIINPHLLPCKLMDHFDSYIIDLKKPENIDLRGKFERRFDFRIE